MTLEERQILITTLKEINKAISTTLLPAAHTNSQDCNYDMESKLVLDKSYLLNRHVTDVIDYFESKEA